MVRINEDGFSIKPISPTSAIKDKKYKLDYNNFGKKPKKQSQQDEMKTTKAFEEIFNECHVSYNDEDYEKGKTK